MNPMSRGFSDMVTLPNRPGELTELPSMPPYASAPAVLKKPCRRSPLQPAWEL